MSDSSQERVSTGEESDYTLMERDDHHAHFRWSGLAENGGSMTLSDLMPELRCPTAHRQAVGNPNDGGCKGGSGGRPLVCRRPAQEFPIWSPFDAFEGAATPMRSARGGEGCSMTVEAERFPFVVADPSLGAFATRCLMCPSFWSMDKAKSRQTDWWIAAPR